MKKSRCVLFVACCFSCQVCFSATDPYSSFDKLPSSDSSQTEGRSPYESLEQLPSSASERHPTLENEYSEPVEGQYQRNGNGP